LRLIEAVEEHSPLWLVGHNCFMFDNAYFAYHLRREYTDKYVQPLSLGKQAEGVFSYILTVPGVNNADTYVYLNASERSAYTGLSLSSLAKQLNVEAKMTMPSKSADNIDEMVTYCTTDSRVTVKIWQATRLADKITAMACTFKCPIYDVVKYSKGIMAACMVASYALKEGKAIDWSVCTVEHDFKGGMVMEPKVGLYSRVIVADFKSMYPTVMLHGMICPEHISMTDAQGVTDEAVLWNTKGIVVSLYDKLCSFTTAGTPAGRAQGRDSVTRGMLRHLIRWREDFKKTQPTFSFSIKVASNSLFGAYGFPGSPMYSPIAAASVTLVARWVLMVACGVFKTMGLILVYGDTDSCFIISPGMTMEQLEHRTRECMLVISLLARSVPPLKGHSMSLDKYDKLLLVDKKNYVYSVEGVITTKGLSVVRKDRVPYVNEMIRIIMSEAYDKDNHV
jgi:DNA polymerase elongation subunit (family B)